MEEKEEYRTELQRKQLEIFEHYGHEKQFDMLVEECSELIQAIMKAKRASYIIFCDDVLQELADVKNLIQQLELKYEHLKKAVDFIVECKVDRQLERIGKGE